MAERRMFAKTIIDSDAFLEMPLSTQALYFHLSMRADDDGFINNPKKIQRMIGASDDDLKMLIAKSFIITFDTGIIVIKHWKIHNYIQKDRYKETLYVQEKKQLSVKDNKAYTEACIQDVSIPETQVSIGKLSIDKLRDSGDKESVGVQGEREPTPSRPETKNVDKSVENPKLGKYANVELTQKELAKLKLAYPSHWERMVDDLSEFMHSSGKTYDRHYDIITGWAGGSV